MKAPRHPVLPSVLLAIVAALLWLASPGQAGSPIRTVASAPPEHVFPFSASLPPTSTPTPSPTPTLEPDPEYIILQYVVTNYPDWSCLGPYGPFGNRYIDDCNPYGFFSHPTSGYVNRYDSAAEAQAAWQVRRNMICPEFPICVDTYYRGYHGYEAGNENYPNAYYEAYYPASVWLMGAASVDDTHFNGAPLVAEAILDAAYTLGYIGNGTATPGTATPTPPRTITTSPTQQTPTGTSSPQTSPTQDARPDLTGNLSWVAVCPAPVLRLTTIMTGQPSSYAPTSTMRLTNNIGEYLDFPVPDLQGSSDSYSYNCEVGPCLPGSWATRHPFTLTVDFNNNVGERDEINNDYVLIYPPPVPTPCGSTPTYTPTPLVTATAISGCEVVFADMPPGSTFYEFVRCLACQEIVGGYACGGPGEPCIPPDNPSYYRPSASVSRGQLSKVVVLATRWQGASGMEPFADVPFGSTFHNYIVRLYDLGYIAGYPCGGPSEPCDQQSRPYFRPNAGATRGQICKIVAQAANINDPIPPDRQTFEDVPPGSTFWIWIERLAAPLRNVVQGYSCGNPEPCVPPDNRPYFRPNHLTMRGQIAKIVSNTFFPGCRAR
jgi:hypothetical protein